jgi:molybdate transport system substrate-binding protein
VAEVPHSVFTRYTRIDITPEASSCYIMRTLIASILLLCLAAAARAETVTVSAAISLEDAIKLIGKAYELQSADKVEFNFGASGPLAAQIEQGAPVDAFISAANKQVDELVKAGKADAVSRRIVAGNSLVLIVPAAEKNPPNGFADLTDQRVQKIAVGQPKAVPAGQYAMQTLQYLKLTDALSGKIIYGANVRQVLDYVVRNEVDAGIVYSTDAKSAGDAVKVVATADTSSHEPIEYPAVIITAGTHQSAAMRFLDFLQSDQAKSIFSAQGFILPKTPATRSAP